MWSGANLRRSLTFKVTSDALTTVYAIVIAIRVDPDDRDRCDVLYLGGVVLDTGHFVDAAAGYSDVDIRLFVFRT